jgi:inhibitor of KinA sporulation pathway (predicted exonuclease)
MKLSNVCNVIDIEHDKGTLVEIGITTIDIQKKEIIKTYSLAVQPNPSKRSLSGQFTNLTGWTYQKLIRVGLSRTELLRRLDLYGCNGRLLVSDTSEEVSFIEDSLATKLSTHRLNVSILFSLMTKLPMNLGLDSMLEYYSLEFEGTKHRAADDSLNIAKLFIMSLKAMECEALLDFTER